MDTTKPITIKGIAGSMQTLGSGEYEIKLKSGPIKYLFHIIPNTFQIPFAGILGSDFLKLHKCIIDYERSTLIMIINGKHVELPLLSNNHTSYRIEPRCEQIISIAITNPLRDILIMPQELCKDVFLPGILTRNREGRSLIKVLNMREEPVIIRNLNLEVHNPNDYEVIQFNAQIGEETRTTEVLKDLDLRTLTATDGKRLTELIREYSDIFHLKGDPLTTTNLTELRVQLKPDAVPKFIKPYRVPHSQKTEINQQVEEMLANDLIEPSVSPWNAPILLVPKKSDGSSKPKSRLVIDYRQLNNQLQDDKFPLPNITDILDRLGNAKFFSCLDLSQGYYQVSIKARDRPCTAFSTDQGHFQMKRLPMGVKIAPSAFSRVMSLAMSGLANEKCFVYLDDIVVFSKDLRSHIANLKAVFNRLREVNLKLNPKKCQFLRREVLYLGHLITANGISPDPSKITAVKNFPIPTNADEVKRFVAFANYYRRFIKNFAQISAPLNRLTQKDVEFRWSNECQIAFDTLRESLIRPPILQYPNFEGNFTLRTDASGFALGAVLSNADDKPIAYHSVALKPAERNYSTIEKELLAIVWAVKSFRPYLFGRRFTIKTDHRPLVWLFSMKDPGSRLMKFRTKLEAYDFDIEFIPGKHNVTADALSRITSNDLKQLVCMVTTRQSKKCVSEIH